MLSPPPPPQHQAWPCLGRALRDLAIAIALAGIALGIWQIATTGWPVIGLFGEGQ